MRLIRLGILALVGSIVASGAALAQSAPQKATIRLDWKAGAQHAPFYLAKARGFYKDEGLDVEIISGSGSSDTVKQVGSGSIDFGLVDALVLVQAAQQRVPVKSMAAYYQRNPIVLISPKDKPITNPKQLLSGIKLGSKKGSATYQGLLALLAANDMQVEQIKMVDIGFGVAPLLVKQVDAIMGFSMNEPIEAEAGGMATFVLPVADFGVDTYGLTIVSNDQLMQSKSAVIEHFLRATRRGIEESIRDPAAAVTALAKAVDEIDTARETKVLERTIPYWQSEETKEHGPGWQTQTRWQHTIDVARKLGLIETDLKPDQVFVNTFLVAK
jgi:NitT/TauT family transport system substrate-binding protein